MARARLVWALVASVSAAEVERPALCPGAAWHSVCRHEATCATLANAGLTCSGVLDIEGCAIACAAPCCVTTSTTTDTSTVTSTHTTVTVTHTETHTSTHTMTSVTMTHRNCHHGHYDDRHRHNKYGAGTRGCDDAGANHLLDLETNDGGEYNRGADPVSTTQGPAAIMRVAMRVKVTDPEDYMSYFDDPRVEAAYVMVMSNLTGLAESQVAVEMAATKQLGNITVTFAVTIPYVDNGTAMVPSVAMPSLRSKLEALEIANFNAMINAAVDAAAGKGIYAQQVLAIVEASGQADVSGAPFAQPPAVLMCLFAALQIFRR